VTVDAPEPAPTGSSFITLIAGYNIYNDFRSGTDVENLELFKFWLGDLGLKNKKISRRSRRMKRLVKTNSGL